jgi:hypothetical protein
VGLFRIWAFNGKSLYFLDGKKPPRFIPVVQVFWLGSIVCVMQNNAGEHHEIFQDIQDQLHKQVDVLKKIQNNNFASRYMNAREAAGYIGISERLFNERLKNGMWTSYKIGRRRVFRPCDLDRDLASFQEKSRYNKS